MCTVSLIKNFSNCSIITYAITLHHLQSETGKSIFLYLFSYVLHNNNMVVLLKCLTYCIHVHVLYGILIVCLNPSRACACTLISHWHVRNGCTVCSQFTADFRVIGLHETLISINCHLCSFVLRHITKLPTLLVLKLPTDNTIEVTAFLASMHYRKSTFKMHAYIISKVAMFNHYLMA